MILRLLALLVTVLLWGVVLTQVIVPAVRGQSLFPFFRKSWRQVRDRHQEARDEVVEASVSAVATEEEVRASRIRDSELEELSISASSASDVHVGAHAQR